MVLVLRCATLSAISGGVDNIRGGILCSQTAQCASSPVGSPADGRHVCGACGCGCGFAGNEWSGRGMSLAHNTGGGVDGMGGGRGGWVGVEVQVVEVDTVLFSPDGC